MNRSRSILLALGVAGLTSLAQGSPVETKGFLKFEVWYPEIRIGNDAGNGTSVDNWIAVDPAYPSKPDMTSFTTGMTSRGVFPDDSHEQYGASITGWFTPTVTDDYNFFIRSDDASELYIDLNDGMGLMLQAYEPNCCNPFQEPSASSTMTTAAPLHMVAGTKYPIQILLKEGGGGDFVEVAMQSATGTVPAVLLTPVVGTMVSSMAEASGSSLTITKQPASVSVAENSSTTFTIEATAVTPYKFYTSSATLAIPGLGGTPDLGTAQALNPCYQWFTNGVEVAGASGTSFTIPLVKSSMNGMKVKCYVAVPGVPTDSSEATLTVTADVTPPTVVKTTSDTSFTGITVKFSEPVTASALTTGNYAVDQGITVSSVTRVDDSTVRLTTSTLAQGTTYNLTINGVKDTGTPGNTIAADTKVQVKTFIFLTGTFVHQKYNNVSDNDGWPLDKLLSDARYPSAPDRADLIARWEYPINGQGRILADDPARNYFDCIEGFFIPPVTTNYVFFICGADRFALYLSTDESSANKHKVAEISGWTNPRNWMVGQSTDMTPSRSDTYAATQWPNGGAISLQKGKKYYMLEIHHDPSWCGADDFAATYTYEGEPDPASGDAPKLAGNVVGEFFDPSGASLDFTQQPQSSVNAMEGDMPTFTAAAAGSSLYGTTILYQWQSAPKGSSTFTDIAGATTTSYTTLPLTVAQDGTQFRLAATLPPLTKYSTVVTVSVAKNTAPPVLTAGAMAGDSTGVIQIGIGFNKPMNDDTLAVAANYSVSAGTISSVLVSSNRFTDNSQNPLASIRKENVVLSVTGFNAASGSVTVSNVKDIYGNAIAGPTTLPFTVDKTMKWGVVGANEFGGWNAVAEVGPGNFDVYSDGVGEWGTFDEATFVYQPVTGDFDKVVRVEYQDCSSEWARAGLIVRESLSNFGMDRDTQTTLAGRYQKCHVNPVGATLTGPGTAGNASWEGNRRLDVGVSTTTALTTGNGVPQYPTAWCRIQRAGQIFTIFGSNDGQNWTQMGTTTWGVDDAAKSPMPATVYVGPEFTPENGNITAAADQGTFLARFRDYGDYTPNVVFTPNLKVASAPTGKVTITWTTGTLVASPTVNGTYTAVSGATSPYVVTPAGPMFYRVKK